MSGVYRQEVRETSIVVGARRVASLFLLCLARVGSRFGSTFAEALCGAAAEPQADESAEQ